MKLPTVKTELDRLRAKSEQLEQACLRAFASGEVRRAGRLALLRGGCLAAIAQLTLARDERNR